MYRCQIIAHKVINLQRTLYYSSHIYCKSNNFISYNLTLIHCPTDKAITEATVIPWITGLSRPIYQRALQFASKYHVSLDSRRPQIWQHIHYSLGQSFMCLQIHTTANSIAHGPQLCDGALILCQRRIRKYDENRQRTDTQRIQNLRPL